MTGHAPVESVPAEAALHPDPELWLVWADMRVWQQAHPCDCNALCLCETALEASGEDQPDAQDIDKEATQ